MCGHDYYLPFNAQIQRKRRKDSGEKLLDDGPRNGGLGPACGVDSDDG